MDELRRNDPRVNPPKREPITVETYRDGHGHDERYMHRPHDSELDDPDADHRHYLAAGKCIVPGCKLA